ncbi:FAD binding domain-containing protein [Denitratisoma oestradiolicum]|uniref:Carbon monoxide dehydrogenase medium chain n=2 Tax=Denitratisoma oestradiolicum TaxID=311182 RepID=A0A6S6Y243_9PROT|nr:xanthine dehydrogenase family protein subunit M [Denitratisoma oestradiolicum]TWO78659.1 molybdopterin dehydrogenase [Denitratisoma oestradiolicum]TWO78729.1 molybdopterin dehydrogenase [Denitratisoma oestradiolicum]TWO78763.1 molybdopterin dehydrogenase [Denitratisoma oestradiolicum]CAB1369276.1 Carbon monoxide dehydrogenase medium chain [Denitratisoma oestradiolicum]
MKPAPFDYHAPATLAEAVRLLQQYEDDGIDAKVLAGGQSLMPMLALRVARPEVLIDLRQVAGLTGIREDAGTIVIGAMEPKQLAAESPLVQQKQPLFHAATELVGHRQIRNRGSVGGSFAHADPASEYPAVALVLDMEFKAVGPGGERSIPAEEFFVTYMTTSLETNEILTEVRMPVMAPGTGWAIQEMARRNGDLALAGVALTLQASGGICTAARIAAFGVNATAVRLPQAEAALVGQALNATNFTNAAALGAAELVEPMTCIHASASYRRQLVKTLLERCLAEAAGRLG